MGFVESQLSSLRDTGFPESNPHWISDFSYSPLMKPEYKKSLKNIQNDVCGKISGEFLKQAQRDVVLEFWHHLPPQIFPKLDNDNIESFEF